MEAGVQAKSAHTLKDLLRHLEKDPRNRALLTEAATRAFDANDPDLAAGLIERAAALGQLPAPLLNLKALLAMAQRRFDVAVEVFAGMQAASIDDPAIRFNFAWSKAMLHDYQGALDLLDVYAVAASPQAPALKVKLLHHLARLDAALELGGRLLSEYPHDRSLAGALASVAIDAERPDLVTEYATLAGSNAEGLSALGTLALREQDVAASLKWFDQALETSADNPRALIGKGLSLLIAGHAAEGAKTVDRGAELFHTHVGSWVAAGWANFLAGDYGAAHDRFRRALALDPNFAETHGGIAVLAALDGRKDDAARESQIASRLDKTCFGAALAKSLLLERQGHPQAARKIVDVALTTPIGPNGETLARLLTAFGRGLPN